MPGSGIDNHKKAKDPRSLDLRESEQRNPHEADANFGRVISGYEAVVPKIRQSMPKDGFLSNRLDWVMITEMKILVPATCDPEDEDIVYVEWKEAETE